MKRRVGVEPGVALQLFDRHLQNLGLFALQRGQLIRARRVAGSHQRIAFDDQPELVAFMDGLFVIQAFHEVPAMPRQAFGQALGGKAHQSPTHRAARYLKLFDQLCFGHVGAQAPCRARAHQVAIQAFGFGMRHQRVQAFVTAGFALQPVALALRVRHQTLASQQVERLADG
ncbi:hypothetical protein D3C72_1475350 [compost metagenome]